MPQSPNPSLTPLILGNDKLLKALITLLALRDEHLMQELRTVFIVAHSHDNGIGDAGEDVWAHVRGELDLISSLIEDADADLAAAPASN